MSHVTKSFTGIAVAAFVVVASITTAPIAEAAPVSAGSASASASVNTSGSATAEPAQRIAGKKLTVAQKAQRKAERQAKKDQRLQKKRWKHAKAKCTLKPSKKKQKKCRVNAKNRIFGMTSAVAGLAPSAGSASVNPASFPAATAGRCYLGASQIPEASGLTSSLRWPGIVWTHNDSGDSARIFAIEVNTCALKATVNLGGVRALDFESISSGRDANGTPMIWVGDTGDNGHGRPYVTLYKFPEPTLADQTVSASSYRVTYNDGRKDVETLMVDPRPGGPVWLASKEMNGGLYQLPANFQQTGGGVATRVGAFRPFPTDGAISPDGTRVVVRSGDCGWLYDAAFPAITGKKSFMFPKQQQGEGITFSQDSKMIYLISEGRGDLIRIPVSSYA